MEELKTAVEIVMQAGRIIADGWKMSGVKVAFKGQRNLVTEIDKKTETYIVGKLKEFCPEYGILTEESEGRTGSTDARWILDPLDGTTNFTKRYPFVAVSLALEKAGELVIGVVYNPILDECFIAEKGKGAYCNGKQIHVGSVTKLQSSVLASGFPYDAWENPDNNSAQWAKLITKTISLRCDGSAALDLCRVADGQLDGYWEKGLSPWDMAAGIVIVREAGGMATDYLGGTEFFRRTEIVASNETLQPLLRAAVLE